MGEHGQPILDNVFVEQDARFGLAQQSRQRSLSVQEPNAMNSRAS
jgi:hypothetical protein